MKRNGLICALLTLCTIGGTAMATMKTRKASAEDDTPWFTPADFIYVDESSDEKYQANRRFVCSGGIEVTGNRIWSSTMSGGPTEPHEDNYYAVTFSDDMGETWAPGIAIDNLTYPEQTRVFDSELWKAPDGKLWIFYTQTGGAGDLWGSATNTDYPQAAFAYVIENPTANPEEFKVVNKGLLYKGGRIFSKPAVIELDDGTTEWIVPSHVHWTEYTDVLASKDQGETWYLKGRAKGIGCGAHESWIAQLSDGTLMMNKRIDQGVNGGVEISYSYDFGKTWSNYENNLGEPFVAPGSRSDLYRLASGNLLYIANHSATKRTDLTVYMSTDDGMTWPYSLLLDDRDNPNTSWVDAISYPDVTQTSDGKIYVAWDYERTTYAETRFSAFTEQNIIDGKFTEDCIYKRPVFKNNSVCRDIVRFERFGGIPTAFTFGTTKGEIAASQLTEMTVFLSDGSEYDITGTWDSADFEANKAGRFRFTFTPDSLPQKTEDVQGVLTTYITVLEENAVAVTGIELASAPAKLNYTVGEELDLSGMVIKAKYSDGGKKTLTEREYTVTGYDKTKAGEQKITVSYEGKTAEFTVNVSNTQEDSSKKGCGSSLSVCGAITGLFCGLSA
ncbi:MAG: exo-alpha-sialidase, partial [Candidatus Scatosoma sp.]